MSLPVGSSSSSVCLGVLFRCGDGWRWFPLGWHVPSMFLVLEAEKRHHRRRYVELFCLSTTIGTCLLPSISRWNDGSYIWWRLIKSNRYVPHTNWVLCSGLGGTFLRIGAQRATCAFFAGWGAFDNARVCGGTCTRWRTGETWNKQMDQFQFQVDFRTAGAIATQFMNSESAWIAKRGSYFDCFIINWFKPGEELESVTLDYTCNGREISKVIHSFLSS